MKKYILFIFFYTFIALPSFAQDNSKIPLTDMDLSFAKLEKKRGITAKQFIDLLANPPWSFHIRIFSWIDELLEQNDPDIDIHLLQLLTQDRWANSPDSRGFVSMDRYLNKTRVC